MASCCAPLASLWRSLKPSNNIPNPQQGAFEPDPDAAVWGPIKNIPSAAFVAVAAKHLPVSADTSEGKVIARNARSFNYAAVVEFKNESKVCVKVPSHGWSGRWNTAVDAELLRSEALTMKYIGQHTKMPIPEVYGFDSTLQNAMGAPYIAMGFIEGRMAKEVWMEDSALDQASDRRLKLLKSLAQAMSCLKDISFHRIGMLGFGNDADTPFVKDSWLVHASPGCRDRTVSRQMFCSSARVYFLQELNELSKRISMKKAGHLIHILRLLIEAVPLRGEAEGEASFGLMHPRLDLDNIIVDEDLQVTGLIGWSGVQTLPVEVGWASCPRFLREDWLPGYTWPGEAGFEASLAPNDFDEYRKLYRMSTEEASGAGKSTTEKPYLYNTLHEAVTSDSSETAVILVEGLMQAVLPRAWMAFLERVKMEGFSEAEDAWLRSRFAELF